MPFRMVFDVERCVACGTCAIACMDQCDTELGRDTAHRRVMTRERMEDGRLTVHYLSMGCMHCARPACMAACGRGCYHRDAETGVVVLDKTRCVGCQRCVRACPLGAVSIDGAGKADKCNGCIERLKLGLPPACVKACQNEAIRFEYTEDAAQADNMEHVAALAALLRASGG